MSVESRNGGGEVKEYQVRVRHLTKTRKESWETVHPWDGEKDRARKVYRRFQKLMKGTSALVTWEERISPQAVLPQGSLGERKREEDGKVGPNFGSNLGDSQRGYIKERVE